MEGDTRRIEELLENILEKQTLSLAMSAERMPIAIRATELYVEAQERQKNVAGFIGSWQGRTAVAFFIGIIALVIGSVIGGFRPDDLVGIVRGLRGLDLECPAPAECPACEVQVLPPPVVEAAPDPVAIP